MARRKRRYFSQEFKDEAVRMVLDGPRPITHVARDLDVHETTLGSWVKAYRLTHGADTQAASGPGEGRTERELQLERENRRLREENAFLKKAAAFFAREHP
ncbi:transposase-like protein [Actinomadura rupiterrae]|nr:transposase-like protein [Actinomadura rupiterrae]MCP2337366.1 transposase-like protein [Actinomadura rupiterrae]MCP2340669.1 transposase-like protein [Actinomadura rupiterrae]MCP2343140.1 transposase-like protein [Actinomadura rupiterrae]MCP2343794.1 transposase-like protein [Actinomadura rupiterrae]